MPDVAFIDVLPRGGAGLGLPEKIRQWPPSAGRIEYALRALRLGLRQRLDLVFCGHLYMAPLALLIARFWRAKLVIQTHGVEIWSKPTALQRQALEKADLVLSVSRHTRGQVLSWTAATPERVVVIPNTVGEEFTPGEGAKVRQRLGLQGRRVLLSLSRLDARERYKGQDRVIRLIGPLVARGHDAVFVIGGDGDDRPRLERLARDCGGADRVLFLGAIANDARVNLYRMADLYVMPSTGEGFGIAFVEAMACGCPAVGLRAGGAADALCDGELGVACGGDELLTRLHAVLSARRFVASPLAAGVAARFGKAAFETRVAQVSRAYL